MLGSMRGWRAGEIGGVEVRLDVSLLLIAALVTVSLAAGLFPVEQPGYAPIVYWIVALSCSGIFVGSILWHEMAHALVAIRYRIPVLGIVLHLFGGAAQIGRDPERPIQEFTIAIAGPLSSLFLAIFFGVLSGMAGLSGTASRWLATVNLILALFNLLPGFPLDGGRVLRALLWKLGGSYRRATRQASRVGQGMAALFVVAGLVLILRGLWFNGIWFMLIAAFLYSAATSSFRTTGAGPMSLQTSVQRVMRFSVPLIEPSLPLALLAWKYLDYARDQAFPVMEHGQLVGVISGAECEQVPRLEWGKTRVRERMIPRHKLVIISMQDDLESAMQALDRAGLDHAPVFEGSHFAGMLNRRDIVYRT